MPQNRNPLSRPSIHFIGVGGIGTSALARWFLSKKWVVSGSDACKSSITEELMKEGLKLKIGHKKANLPPKGPNMVVYSPAIPQNNPELKEARKRKIKPLSYPETLGCLTRVYKTIAVGGSHGKSTTTALVGLVLKEARFDPTIIVGTKLKELGDKNFRAGKSDWLVIEADEWRASFLNYSPLISIITNVDKEHLDFYKNLTAVKKTFLKFIANTRQNGLLILNQDDPNLFALKKQISRIAASRNLKMIWYSQNSPSARVVKKVLKIPGRHNVSNALSALTLAETVGIRKSAALKAIASYSGAWRRMEYRGVTKISNLKIRIYDDYAHHPTEIRATLSAFREKFSRQKIFCVYQPHQARRLKSLFADFVSAFAAADLLILLPTYEVAGRDRASKTWTSRKLEKEIRAKYPQKEIYYLANPKTLKAFLQSKLKGQSLVPSPVLVMMGAGNITNFTSFLITKNPAKRRVH